MTTPPPLCDRLFEALNGRQLRVRGAEWRVEVYGVFETNQHRWVQLALEGTRPHVITLHLEASQSPAQAVRSLKQWLTDPSATSAVLQRVA